MNYNEAFPSKFLRVSDLNGKELTVTVSSVEYESIGNEQKLVAYFREHDKALPLNKTNAASLAKIASSADTKKWASVKAVLFPSEVFFQGEMKDCIRIRAPRSNGSEPGLQQPLSETRAAF